MRRVGAVLLAIGSVVAGVAVVGVILFMALIFEFGSPPDGTDLAVAVALGAPIALGGIIIAIIEYRRAGTRSGVTIGSDRLTIAYPAFSRALVVPRALIRAIAIEETGTRSLARERFAVAGDLPADVFVDALDVPSAGFGDLDTARRDRIDPTPAVIWERPDRRAYGMDDAHDDPDRAGWASGGSAPPPPPPPRDAFLFSRQGHSLPFLRSDMLDVPNVAIVFREPIRLPRASWWFGFGPRSARSAFYRGGRETRGVLLNVGDPTGARMALESWDVVRPITAEDVIEQGLLLAKPLVGWRALAYALLIGGPALLSLIIRWLR